MLWVYIDLRFRRQLQPATRRAVLDMLYYSGALIVLSFALFRFWGSMDHITFWFERTFNVRLFPNVNHDNMDLATRAVCGLGRIVSSFDSYFDWCLRITAARRNGGWFLEAFELCTRGGMMILFFWFVGSSIMFLELRRRLFRSSSQLEAEELSSMWAMISSRGAGMMILFLFISSIFSWVFP
jgi:hypothetical protein